MKAYLANGLFGMGDRLLNSLIASEIRKELQEKERYILR